MNLILTSVAVKHRNRFFCKDLVKDCLLRLLHRLIFPKANMSTFFCLAEDEGKYSSQPKGNTGGTGHQCTRAGAVRCVFIPTGFPQASRYFTSTFPQLCWAARFLFKSHSRCFGGVQPESLQAVQRSEETAYGRLGSEKGKSRWAPGDRTKSRG